MVVKVLTPPPPVSAQNGGKGADGGGSNLGYLNPIGNEQLMNLIIQNQVLLYNTTTYYYFSDVALHF